MTELENAKAALANFKKSMDDGHPWIPGVDFINNPGLDRHILNALGGFVREHQEARWISMSDDPNWLPLCVAPDRRHRGGWKRYLPW